MVRVRRREEGEREDRKRKRERERNEVDRLLATREHFNSGPIRLLSLSLSMFFSFSLSFRLRARAHAPVEKIRPFVFPPSTLLPCDSANYWITLPLLLLSLSLYRVSQATTIERLWNRTTRRRRSGFIDRIDRIVASYRVEIVNLPFVAKKVER